MLTGITRNFWKIADRFVFPEVEERLKFVKDRCNTWGYHNELGYSYDWLKRELSISYYLYKHYFRMETFGIDQIPEGRVMLIGNHSGQFAYDGNLVITAMFMEANPPRFSHAMVEHFFATQPLYSILMPRIGQITGLKENCVRLLEEDNCVIVFPEGVNGGAKVFFDRYKLMKFGHGFMQMALETQTPIVPFGFIGGEEMVVSFSKLMPLAKLLGAPYIPLSPTGLLPMPAKCYLYFGAPLYFNDDPFDDDAVAMNVDKVKTEIRKLLDLGLSKRKSVFRG